MRRLSVLVGVLATLLALAVPAAAVPPFAVTDQVTDRAGALDGDRAEVEEALAELEAENGTRLHVVLVGSFDGLSGFDWAREVAVQSQLGSSDVLLAVALDDREYGVSVAESYRLPDEELNDLLVDRVRPELADDDVPGAVVAFARGLSAGAPGPSGSGAATAVVVGVLVVGALVGLLVWRARSRRRAAQPPPVVRLEPPDPHAGTPTEELQSRASGALLELDEAVRTSQLDLDYARAQYGEAAVAGFGTALATSRDELARAFTLRQQLDDEVPEDEPTTRRMLGEILQLTAAADARLDEQAAAFDELRDLERTAPQAIEALTPELAALRSRLPREEQRLADLRERYAAPAVAAVADNVEQARARLVAAEHELAEARTEVGEGRTGDAVGSLRAAEDAVAQAGTLLDAVDRLAADLTAAEGRVAAVRAETEADLAEARALVEAGDRSGLGPQIARGEAALASSGEALRPTDGGRPDPLEALRRLEEAGIALEQALAVARDARTRHRRAVAALEPAVLSARSAVAAARDFVGTRRGAVGPEARTRLAEAERHLDLAGSLRTDDPVAALREAQQAGELARSALELAQVDVQRWSGGWAGGYGGAGAPGPPGGPGPGYGAGYGTGGFGGASGRGGVDLGSLLLGGVLLGGDRGRWGGPPVGRGGWGGSSGRRGGSGRRGAGGSFGGSASRGRRGAGGRF
ncbi:TPM domain-containing protein [Geodermatophilus sp. YIM 151500]|uniref:TPM domain-containing protein n=1 Tax=Geodermatophilus sp. YIM 151500 TaxID=2984531 RepID=UPI0021E45377|nr:TPM domain-containing protein [Geodermatophilus sp. YIM 151500]MCV2491073.1 TPM domain-containing protein [Geodermatophilus sp. YIM 151500]